MNWVSEGKSGPEADRPHPTRPFLADRQAHKGHKLPRMLPGHRLAGGVGESTGGYAMLSKMPRPQPYTYYVLYTVVAEACGLDLRDVFLEPEKVAEAYRRLPEVWSERLWAAVGERFAVPVLQSTSYDHLSTLGVQVDWPRGGEPKPRALLRGPEDVEKLANPARFLECGLPAERRRLWERLVAAWGEGLSPIPPGYGAEGPVTSAVLLAGQDFLTWPYDCPEAAHRLLEFCTRSAHAFQREYFAELGTEFPVKVSWIFDDFAGMFPPALFREFVLPYWNLWYELAGCERRCVHTELLRPEHLPLLAEAKVDHFDPGVDQYLTPRDVVEKCPCAFQLRIPAWHVRGRPVEQVVAEYRKLAEYEPVRIEFGMYGLEEEENFLGLLEVARERAGE